jgi:hypothetical protein
MAALEAYQAIGDPDYKAMLIRCADYELRGECPQTGQTIGLYTGVYQREKVEENFTKAITSSSYAVKALYAVHTLTGADYYKAAAERIHAFVELLRDSTPASPTIDRYSREMAADTGEIRPYGTGNESPHFDSLAAMANLAQYAADGTPGALTQAQATMNATIDHYWNNTYHEIKYAAKWAFHAIVGLVEIRAADANTYWRDVLLANCYNLTLSQKDSNGWYMENWANALTDPIEDVTLLGQAPTALSLLIAGGLT